MRKLNGNDTRGEGMTRRGRTVTLSARTVGVGLWALWAVFIAGAALAASGQGPQSTIAQVLVLVVTIPWLVWVMARAALAITRFVPRSRSVDDSPEPRDDETLRLRRQISRMQIDMIALGLSVLPLVLAILIDGRLDVDRIETRSIAVTRKEEGSISLEAGWGTSPPSIRVTHGRADLTLYPASLSISDYSKQDPVTLHPSAEVELYIGTTGEGVLRVTGNGRETVILPTVHAR